MLQLSVRTGRSCNSHIFARSLPLLGQCACSCKRYLASRPKSDETDSGGKPTIKWFKQLLPGSRRTRIDPAEEDGGEFSKEAQALKGRIDELRAEIADLRGANKPSLIEPLIATLSEEDQAKVRKALAEPDKDEEDDVDLFEQDVSLIELPKLAKLGPRLKLSAQQTVYLQNLDKRLREAADDIVNPTTRRNLWRAYGSAKRNLPFFLHLIPQKIFRTIWESQGTADVTDSRRAGHLCIVAADLSASGKELTKAQALLYIDSLIREGRLQDARIQWESYEAHLAGKEESRLEYGFLGVQLFAKLGNPERAEEIALNLLPEAQKDKVSPILVPVIGAWLERENDESVKHAWGLYMRLRTTLGPEISVRDYDYLTLSFLGAGRTDIALAVFKDLMLSGKDNKYKSEELYKTSLGLVGELHSRSLDSAQLNKVSLTALTVTPRQFQNKYFYGSWMKHLLGIGKTDAAALVVELMIERGVKPDSKHLNGIIGAWLRGGSPEERAKAEQMGWAMIRQRLAFVQERRGQQVEEGRKEDSSTGQVARYSQQRLLAPATIETFSLLLLDYERRSLQKQAEMLKECFSKAEISPNSYWINHLMYAQLRQGRHNIAWDIYKHRPNHVLPDLETFACLWDCEKRHLDRMAVYPDDNFPSPRRMLREMLTWYTNLGKGARKHARSEASQELYHQILRCLCLQRDLEGTIVALFALKELFDIWPDQDTARMITLQVARIATGGQRSGRRRRTTLSAHGQSKDAIAKMSQVLDLVTEQRREKLQSQGVDPTKFDDERRGQEMAIVLATFLQIVLRETNEISAIADKIQQAALDSGAPPIDGQVELITE